jgi:hypothetical protein
VRLRTGEKRDSPFCPPGAGMGTEHAVPVFARSGAEVRKGDAYVPI